MNEKENSYGEIKKTLFPPSLFGIYMGILLIMSGLHIGLIVLTNEMSWNVIVQTMIPLIYWSLVAMGLTLFTRKKIKEVYERPLHKMAEATKKVANGDFSVYVPAVHSSDKLDYLDVMILDFDRMVEALGSVETLKTDFVSNVSHEMKTPVAVIKNCAELLQKKSMTEEQRLKYSIDIESAADRLSTLVTNILKLNKLENQTIDVEVHTYDVCRQICDCVLQYENLWEEKQIELDVDMDDTAWIEADESLMELVWNNLISNALKFTDSGGNVTVGQKVKDGNVIISITDTGCGMSEESIKHIWDKFYQGDTSHSKEGNGLGLAMVKRVMDLMNGNIEIHSKEGEGSTFTVTIKSTEQESKK